MTARRKGCPAARSAEQLEEDVVDVNHDYERWYYLMRAANELTGATGWGLASIWWEIGAGDYESALAKLRQTSEELQAAGLDGGHPMAQRLEKEYARWCRKNRLRKPRTEGGIREVTEQAGN